MKIAHSYSDTCMYLSDIANFELFPTPKIQRSFNTTQISKGNYDICGVIKYATHNQGMHHHEEKISDLWRGGIFGFFNFSDYHQYLHNRAYIKFISTTTLNVHYKWWFKFIIHVNYTYQQTQETFTWKRNTPLTSWNLKSYIMQISVNFLNFLKQYSAAIYGLTKHRLITASL